MSYTAHNYVIEESITSPEPLTPLIKKAITD